MVTVELAVATLAALALLLMMLWGIYLVVMQLRCVDTAAAVARQEARGDDAGVRLAKSDAELPATASAAPLVPAPSGAVAVAGAALMPASNTSVGDEWGLIAGIAFVIGGCE